MGLLPNLQPGCAGAAPGCQRREVGQLGASRLLADSSWEPIPVSWFSLWAFAARPCSESLRPYLQGGATWPTIPSTRLSAIQRRGRTAGGAGGQDLRTQMGRPPLGRYGGCYPVPKVQGCCHCCADLAGAPEPHAGTVCAVDASTNGSGRPLTSLTSNHRRGARGIVLHFTCITVSPRLDLTRCRSHAGGSATAAAADPSAHPPANFLQPKCRAPHAEIPVARGV